MQEEVEQRTVTLAVDAFLSDDTNVTANEAKEAYEHLESIDPSMKKFSYADGVVSFDVQRISRLNELISIDIVKEYGSALSRIGHPFDFTGNEQTG